MNRGGQQMNNNMGGQRPQTGQDPRMQQNMNQNRGGGGMGNAPPGRGQNMGGQNPLQRN